MKPYSPLDHDPTVPRPSSHHTTTPETQRWPIATNIKLLSSSPSHLVRSHQSSISVRSSLDLREEIVQNPNPLASRLNPRRRRKRRRWPSWRRWRPICALSPPRRAAATPPSRTPPSTQHSRSAPPLSTRDFSDAAHFAFMYLLARFGSNLANWPRK